MQRFCKKKNELANLLALFCFDCQYRAVLIQARAIKTLYIEKKSTVILLVILM